MEWKRCSEDSDRIEVDLDQSEAHAFLQAIMRYSFGRLDRGNSVPPSHLGIIEGVSGFRNAELTYPANAFRRFTGILLDYADATASCTPGRGGNGALEWLPTADMDFESFEEGQLARRLAADIKTAVLAFEGRDGAQLSFSEFIQEEN